MHMVAAKLGFEKPMVGTRWATPHPDCMDRLRKHYSHLAEGWYLARKAAWSLSGCMATNSADYYMLVNEWAWSKSRDCLLRLHWKWTWVQFWMLPHAEVSAHCATPYMLPYLCPSNYPILATPLFQRQAYFKM